jgi:hypothetical protein
MSSRRTQRVVYRGSPRDVAMLDELTEVTGRDRSELLRELVRRAYHAHNMEALGGGHVPTERMTRQVVDAHRTAT